MSKQDPNNLFDSPLSPAARKSLEADILRSNTQIHTNQDSVEQEDLDLLASKDTVLASIDKNINNLFARLSPSFSGAGDTSSEVLDTMLSLANKNVAGSKRKGVANKKQLAELETLKKDVVAANQQQLSQMIAGHKRKVTDAVATNNMIIKIIPKMRLALNTFANTIISPDDFTKQSIAVSVSEATMSAEDAAAVSKRANGLLTQFKLNKNIKEDVLSYLVNGRLFYLVLPMNKELSNLLNEAVDAEGSLDTVYRKSTSTYFTEMHTRVLTEKAADIKSSALQESAKAIRETFNIKDGDDSLMESACKKIDDFISREFLVGDAKALINDAFSSGLNEKADLSSFFTPNMERFASVQQNTVGQQQSYNDEDAVKPSDIKGKHSAVVRRVSPANIIPLDFEGNNYGYIHLDIVEVDPDNHVLPVDNSSDVEGMGMLPSSSHALSNGNILQNIVSSSQDININGNNQAKSKNYENPTGGSIDAVEDARLQFMATAFANKLSRETNLKMLRRNDTLKTAIYNGLAIKKLNSSEKVRIVYLKPEEVVYINRGQSIFDNVLFFAKLYIATLISILLQNVLRGGEQRVVYVEVGGDNNGAHAVQQVIRDMKSKEISSITNMDLQTVLNIQSQFQDYYIPVVDGEKPLSFENLDSLSNKSIDDEFLSWLSNNIFSGIGLPAAYLTEVENVDFAKSLSMQNSRFLRDCIAEQSTLSDGFTELIRKIYEIECNDNANVASKKKVKKKQDGDEGNGSEDTNIDVNLLSIKLPAPAALSLMNISEQLGNATSLLDSLIAAIDLTDVPTEKREAVTALLKTKLIRKYVTSFDWVEMEQLVEASISEFMESENEKALLADTTDVAADADTATVDDATATTDDDL